MHDLYERVHRLHNLIWMLGWAGQNVDPAYDPGPASTTWRARISTSPITAIWRRCSPRSARSSTSPCRSASTNGPIPDPATLGPQADWLWFMTWHTRWLKDPAQNWPEELAAWYGSERYVTRDELPRRL